MKLQSFLTRLYSETRGATAVEYGLICAMIVLAMLGALSGFARESIGMWNMIEARSAEATSGGTP